jgi:hypothetical protein
MTFMKAALLVGLLMSSLGTAASAEPFAFRGIPLGTALADFRKMPYPDAAKDPKARPLCRGDKDLSRDPSARIDLSDAFVRIGVVACKYFTPGPRGISGIYAAAPDFANIGGYETTFLFAPAAFHEPLRLRLYMVMVTPRSDHYQTIVDALAVKYGKPTDVAVSKVKNRMGAEFNDEVATWKNDSSSITVKKFNDNIGQSIVLFLSDPLSDAVNNATAALANENAKKL